MMKISLLLKKGRSTVTVPATSLIPAMTASQLRTILVHVISDQWMPSPLFHKSGIPGQMADNLVEAVTTASAEDDLDLSEGPLDVIVKALRETGALGSDDADEVGVLVYEALIDANHLPGINAQRHVHDSLDDEE
jgi:hypothetical protein